MDKVYKEAPWFKEVIQKGIHISDMFMGFRKVPHFIIAVTREEKGEKWILWATVDTEAFRSLVENVKIGTTGEVYLLNREGYFQTTPRFSGGIMQKTDFPLGMDDEGIRIGVLKSPQHGSGSRPPQVVAQEWLKSPRWMLVVKQDYAEAFDTVNHANFMVLLFLHVSALSILVVSIFVTRYMIRTIRERDIESDHLSQQLMQTGKLAAIGELSAGVAHEINNPLAIILTERQLLLDSASQTVDMDPEFRTALYESLTQIDVQVGRCKRITHNLLKFARRTRSVIETVNLNTFIQEMIELVEREAKSNGIRFSTDLDQNLPLILSDPSQLQQVFLNLITNAIDAHEAMPFGNIRLKTACGNGFQGVKISIEDTGCGIPREHLAKIFGPFFTTKPVGKGTGLGLSICYSIIRHLGGDIQVQSKTGKGTTFTLLLPHSPPREMKPTLAHDDG